MFEDFGVILVSGNETRFLEQSSMASNYGIRFFGKGIDIYFQAQSKATPLLFQSMYIAFLGGWLSILDLFSFQAISSSIWFSIKVFFLFLSLTRVIFVAGVLSSL